MATSSRFWHTSPAPPSRSPDRPPVRSRRFSASRDGSVALLLALTFALLFWRAGFEQTLWCDEIFTLALINHAPADIIDQTAVDNHPPLYYFALKTWIRLGRLVGIESGVAWARSLGLILWLLMTWFAWRLGRGIAGPDGGVAFAAAVALASQLAWSQTNLRGYAIAAPALAVCFLSMAWAANAVSRETPPRHWSWLWIAYAIAAAAGLWSHLLSAFVLTNIGLWWIVLSIALFARRGRRAWRHPLVLGGALAQTAVVLGFLPWMFELTNQVSNLEGPRRVWLSPLTPFELLRVFIVWHPWGLAPTIHLSRPAQWAFMFSGALAALAPVAAALYARRSFKTTAAKRAADRRASALFAIGWAGLAIAAAFDVTLYVFDLVGWQHLFHGPRYTIVCGPIWGAGLAALALAASARLGRPRLAAALIAPWLFCGVVGHALYSVAEARRGTSLMSGSLLRGLPEPGTALYVLPSELIPYFRKSLAAYDVRRIEEIADAPDGADGLYLLRLNLWSQLNRERDTVVRAMLTSDKLADNYTITRIPPEASAWDYYELIELNGLHGPVARAMGAEGFRVLPGLPLPGSIDRPHPREWRVRDGWNSLEADHTRKAIRWTSRPSAFIRFETPLEPGDYAVALQGLRQPYPQPTETLWIGIEGEKQRVAVNLPAGWFDFRVDLKLTERHEKPVLRLEHPIHRIPPTEASVEDPRPLGILIHQAALVKPPAP